MKRVRKSYVRVVRKRKKDTTAAAAARLPRTNTWCVEEEAGTPAAVRTRRNSKIGA